GMRFPPVFHFWTTEAAINDCEQPAYRRDPPIKPKSGEIARTSHLFGYPSTWLPFSYEASPILVAW
ncbi:MAG TPA: hypothetical protein VFK86_16310, partial [Bauldia sp.]|nr:hypothetical protein [Bauldia sp.]